jgi:ankyrin repeat protein
LFLLVGGIAEITTPDHTVQSNPQTNESPVDIHLRNRKLETGDLIGDIGFFTDSPQVDSVCSLTVCKTLTMSRDKYAILAQDHPGSVGKILQNLLAQVEAMHVQVDLPKQIHVLRAGSVYDVESGYGSLGEDDSHSTSFDVSLRQASLTAVRDLVEMHMRKQLDDHTTRLLFAASRGDTATISLMCDQGFDANNADYDNRTALMVASMKGNTDVVRLLLEYGVSTVEC